MQSKVTEIAPDIYRISTFHSDYGIQFNQFLIKDGASLHPGDMAGQAAGAMDNIELWDRQLPTDSCLPPLREMSRA